MLSWVTQDLLLKLSPGQIRVKCIYYSYSCPFISFLFQARKKLIQLIAFGGAAEQATEVSDENAYRERVKKVSRVAEIEDLQGPRDPPVALLSIKVWRSSVLLFFCSHQP